MNIDDVSGLELTHIRYFVVLAEELHFGRAAQRLHISQPPLTQQIQRLESRIGCPLLRRTSRRVELTEAGRTFCDCGRAVLIEAERAVALTRRVARGEGGALTLATAPSLMLDMLPRAILKFRRRFPSVDLRLREMATSRICDALESGSVDLGLVRGPAIPDTLRKSSSFPASWGPVFTMSSSAFAATLDSRRRSHKKRRSGPVSSVWSEPASASHSDPRQSRNSLGTPW
jgi:DNA-binding transcriptional LysR family regulator